MARDRIYRTPRHPVPPFAFDATVADVFDDMIHRSVPMYAEILRRQSQMVAAACRPGTRIYDLGCSTGNFGLALCDRIPAGGFQMVAVDSSPPMLAQLSKRLRDADRLADIDCICTDIRNLELTRACAVVINFTLQFIPPVDRDRLVQRVYDGLIPGGILLFSEKTVHPDSRLSALEVDFYHRFKRENGYNALEISQKREALENVLIPETATVHQDRLNRYGFTAIDLWFKWFNFCSWICIK